MIIHVLLSKINFDSCPIHLNTYIKKNSTHPTPLLIWIFLDPPFGNIVKARSTPSVLKNETTGCLRRKHNERKAMAQREALRKRIVEHLRNSNDGTSSLKEIVQNLGADKKCINQILYSLKRANAISQVSNVPPVWKLRDYGLAIRAPVWSQNSKLKYRPTSPKKNISRNKVIFCIYIYL